MCVCGAQIIYVYDFVVAKWRARKVGEKNLNR